MDNDTHYSQLRSKRIVRYNAPPMEPENGEFFFDNQNNRWAVYDATAGAWYYANVSTTTSTSTSTTTTSTSTTTTSTSTTTTTSTSTSTSTSTTTTL